MDGRFRRPMALAVRTPLVSTTACSRCTVSMYWAWWLPGRPAIPASGMLVQVTEYFHPVFFS
jgi:CHASE2 domain-containing sensor protein